MIGQTLDHYRIESKLGEGGMGVVYKAHDVRLKRPVAVKVLPPGKIGDLSRKERFMREARAASALNHPGIVTVHDIGSVGDVDFIVTEYIDGRTLDELIPAGGLRVADALKIAVSLADALAAAHAAGILHRDIKPSNVIVNTDGRPKILDFGLAKLSERAESLPDATTLAKPLTEEGAIIGTTAYMSPEQAEGRKVDARSDIFSFGTLLYEMVTGKRPFAADSAMALLGRIVNEEPVPPSRLSALHPDLEKTILRCLRKDPARRYQTMADLKVALEDLQSDTSAAPRRTHNNWLWPALTGALLVAALFGWLAWRARRPVQPLRATALTTFPGRELYPSLSPDGNQVAFIWNGPRQDNEDVYVQMIGSGPPLRLTSDPHSDVDPAWSPDGKWIAFLRGDSRGPFAETTYELRLIAPLGGPERKLAEVRVREVTFPAPTYLAWCPKSDCLVVTDSAGPGQPDGLFVVSLDTGERRPLTRPQPPAIADTSPAVSPDGRSLIFRRTSSWGVGELYVLPLTEAMTAAAEPRRRTSATLRADHPAWLPGGKEALISAKGALWRLDAAGDDPPARLPFVGEDGLTPSVSSAKGERPPRLVYARSFEDENIWRVDTTAPGAPRSSPPAVAIASTRSDIHPQFSPDGKRVAFTSTRSGEWEIWTADPDGASAVQLTSMGANASGAPFWSPDGEQIAFASDVLGQFDIYAIPAAGGKPRRLTSHPAFDHAPRFSRDGRWLYFCSNRAGDYQIWRMPAAGGDAVQLTRNGGCGCEESGDGKDLYYTQMPIAGSALWRMATTGGEPVKVVDGVVWWAFAVVDRGIYYIDRPATASRLRFFDFATQRSTTVASDLGDVRFHPTATRDGRVILYSRVDATVDDLMLVEGFR